MMEKIRIRNKRYRIDFDVYFVWFTYFPFVGWIYTFIFRNNDAFAMHHAKQAFVMAVFFTAVPILITFSTAFFPISYRWIRLFIVILIYLSHVSYFALCAFGFLKMFKGIEFEFPFIKKYAKKLNV